MSDTFLSGLTLAGAVGAGLVAGVFFTFSTFLATALRRLPDLHGLAAMQAINRAAPTPPFMALLFGTALVCVGLEISAVTDLDRTGAGYRVIGGVLYLACIVLTITYHVPRNNALDVVDAADPGAAETWREYFAGWTAWNHLRTLTSAGAAAALILALGAD